MSPHVVLVGDSVFDNKAYTKGQPDVAGHLRGLLPSPWHVTLCAVDGSTTSDLGRQLDRVSSSMTHVIVSVGGNDALTNADLLGLRVDSTANALDIFDERIGAFEESYGYVLEALVHLGRNAKVCTIYNGNLEGNEGRRARIALMMFNDVILRSALAAGLDVIDMRLVCTEPEDFVNAIEPSSKGGRKIAEAIANALGAKDAPRRKIVVSAG